MAGICGSGTGSCVGCRTAGRGRRRSDPPSPTRRRRPFLLMSPNNGDAASSHAPPPSPSKAASPPPRTHRKGSGTPSRQRFRTRPPPRTQKKHAAAGEIGAQQRRRRHGARAPALPIDSDGDRNGREGERHCERSSGRRQKRPAVMDDDERWMVSSPCPPLVPLAAVERALDRLSSSSENRTEGRAVALPRGMTCPNSNADDGRASPAPPTPSRTTQGTHLQRRPRVLADFGCP